MLIRAARPGDAAVACQLLRRSIVELCHADHRGDAAVLEKWLANKTPDNITKWIMRADNNVFVAERDGEILGVAAVTDRGEILLNYVSPDARFCGITKALLARMEAAARARGNTECTLTSTATAHRLYLEAGYRDRGAPPSGMGVATMVKRLTPD